MMDRAVMNSRGWVWAIALSVYLVSCAPSVSENSSSLDLDVAQGSKSHDEHDVAEILRKDDGLLVERGRRLFIQCKACHAIGPEEAQFAKVGPALNNIVGADIGSVDGFEYSDALLTMDGQWTRQSLSLFLKAPNDYAPGTIMAYAGLSNTRDRAAIIAYLESHTPVD
nr:c-type cytochrome [Hyphomonas sp. Mor2]